MENKKLTPMMELIEWMNTPADVIKDGLSVKQKATELLEKERQMVIDAVNDTENKNVKLGNNAVSQFSRGKVNSLFFHSGNEGLQYYNETFKTKQ